MHPGCGARPLLPPLLLAPSVCKGGYDCGRVYKFKIRFYVALTSIAPLRMYVYHPATMLGLCVKPYATNATEALLCGMGALGAAPAAPGSDALHESNQPPRRTALV